MEKISERQMVMVKYVGFHTHQWGAGPSKNFLWKAKKSTRVAMMYRVQLPVVGYCDVVGKRHTGDDKRQKRKCAR